LDHRLTRSKRYGRWKGAADDLEKLVQEIRRRALQSPQLGYTVKFALSDLGTIRWDGTRAEPWSIPSMDRPIRPFTYRRELGEAHFRLARSDLAYMTAS
jgi:hypothetical protein